MSATATRPAVRPATDADAAVLRRIVDESRAEEFAALPPDVRAQMLDLQFAAQTSQYASSYPNALTCAIEVGGEVVGRVVVDETDAGVHIVDLAVAAAERGRGVGTAVLEGLLRAAAASSSAVTLSVFSANDNARRLYERLGFVAESSAGGYTAMAVRPAFAPRYDDFAARVGSAFAVSIPAADAPATAVLESCERVPAPEGQSTFVLRFRVALAHEPAQGSYIFSGEGFAPTAVFVVPTGVDEAGTEYEAVFNHGEGGRS